jgi:hypothetical protein
VERDIGRLAKYTFDMGGAGDLLSLALNVPPWENLHELSREELRLTNLVTTDMLAQPNSPNATVIELAPKPAQEIAAKAGIKPSLYKDRISNERGGWLPNAALALETFLHPDMRSSATEARGKRLDRSKSQGIVMTSCPKLP